ncbi:hypothetical protein OIU84_018371 [Salix udensis]|uniref:50S ribosomal protein L18, chloroplastic n=1 Tax=Salix udensis TaxID=889485 RepID=A0AAD6KW79_9ROSI|nr:hypothetical protein OIU84_018371 [Salix udensis]
MGSSGTCSLWSAFLGGGGQQLWASVAAAKQRSSPSLSFVTVEAKAKTRREDRTARHIRIRKKVDGTPDRPRLCVFRSNKHLYVQVIDDTKMHTLASASTMQKPFSQDFDYSSGPTLDVAKKVGELIAKVLFREGDN